MGFPRDYLDFTLWYLQKKGYVSKTDNAQYALSAEGVDFVETQRANIPDAEQTAHQWCGILGRGQCANQYREARAAPEPPAAPSAPKRPRRSTDARSGPIVLPSSMSKPEERRLGRPERRVGKADHRDKKVERRFHDQEWREESQA